jgi:hypothetical protein
MNTDPKPCFGKPDPHQSENPDPDPQQSLMQDPNPHKKQNSGASEAKNGAMRAQPGGSQWSRRGSENQWNFADMCNFHEELDPDPHQSENPAPDPDPDLHQSKKRDPPKGKFPSNVFLNKKLGSPVVKKTTKCYLEFRNGVLEFLDGEQQVVLVLCQLGRLHL